MRRWSHLSLDDLDEATYDGLQRYLGGRELGDLRKQAVDDLPPVLYDRLRFILAWRRLEAQDPRLGEVPYAGDILDHMGQALEEEILQTPVEALDRPLEKKILDQLRASGILDDPSSREKLIEQPIGRWNEDTAAEVAQLLGRRFIESHKELAIDELPDQTRQIGVRYLDSQRRFVDEDRVQHFLVHQHLDDLPPEVQQATLQHLASSRLDRLSRRKISNLDVSTRQIVTDSLQRMGFFTDPARRDELRSHSLTDLKPKVRNGFGLFLARQQLDHHAVGHLNPDARDYVIDELKDQRLLSDPARVKEMETHRLDELDGRADEVRQELVAQLREDLATKTMEELPPGIKERIHRALNERNYFVDEEKVSWYERKTIAQLGSELLHGLEQHLGTVRLAKVAIQPFRALPADLQEGILSFLDEERLLADRAERLRLTQAGNLSELAQEVRDELALYLGRQWLVSIRDRRPPALPDVERELAWAYLRDAGYFVDEFKEELFAFQRLHEFGAETQQAIEQTVVDELVDTLKSRPVTELPAEIQAEVRSRLRQADYFVDEDRLRQIAELPVDDLPEDLQQAVEAAFGSYLLSQPSHQDHPGQALDALPVAELPEEIREALWRYLDEIGYFVDEKKQNQILDRRLADLGSEFYEQAVADLVSHLRQEIGDRPVSELDEELRQGLRGALEELGYFESDAVRHEVLSRPLGSFRREDLDVLAVEFGRHRLDKERDKGLLDLDGEEREAVLSHLQAHDWFLDRSKLDRIRATPLDNLEPKLSQDVVTTVRQEHMERLRQRRLSQLKREERSRARRYLQERGLAADESEMRPLRRQQMSELDPDIYQDLLRDLGSAALDEWESIQFEDLPEEQQSLMSAYLGRRIMGRIERRVLLYTISRLWIDYLTDIEDLRRGIGLEAYGQRDPLVEYKRRAFELFEDLGENIRRTAVRWLFRQSPEPLNTT
jgi:hypothetical protein